MTLVWSFFLSAALLWCGSYRGAVLLGRSPRNGGAVLLGRSPRNGGVGLLARSPRNGGVGLLARSPRNGGAGLWPAVRAMVCASHAH